MTLQKTILGLACAAMTAAGAIAAHADINPTSITPTVTGSGPYTYAYLTEVSATETVTTGDFFTFVDFGGLVSGTETAPSGWVATENLVGPPAVGASGTVAPTFDSTTIPDVTFTYSGPDIVGLQSLGTFTLQSSDAPASEVVLPFMGRATLSPTSYGIKNANLTSYLGPSAAVPEPSTFALFGFGGLILPGLIVRARKARKTIA